MAPTTRTSTQLTTLYGDVYCIPISNLDDLKDRVRTCWENLDQQIIVKFIDRWRDKLKAVVPAGIKVRWNAGAIKIR